ncbi:hypothetical protein AV530_006059 [Patagioenas fasciata monilis]|uniref:Uncharacterized protein n=1 Tax=Patagioenas fasciata monilis TaxID=372326 RepID=A0A1V4J8B5_PATFA|nr:hypothetical protein AV530_006059 [Patagioenas fasciata monilis]
MTSASVTHLGANRKVYQQQSCATAVALEEVILLKFCQCQRESSDSNCNDTVNRHMEQHSRVCSTCLRRCPELHRVFRQAVIFI